MFRSTLASTFCRASQWQATRSMSTARETAVAKLSFSAVAPPFPSQPAKSKPIVILHGLFGSKQNWKALSKAMASRLNTNVYSLDLRNHGESEHIARHDYPSMAKDVDHFIKEHSIDRPMVIGHSMGGKVAMSLALNQAPIDRLVVVDMAPAPAKLSSVFQSYCKVMEQIQAAKVRKQSEADKMMAQVIDDIGVRQFLLTNLKRDPETGEYSFRIPLATLGQSLKNLGCFEFETTEHRFDGKTLFIKGNRSDYISDNSREAIRQFFPHSRIEGLDAGHWVHAEKPEEFLKLVIQFAQEQ
ncbi:hypothetical protein DFQ27_007681 [Actinomortierella ambigua]|uniref:AB hydrolase-1 domain-containing protein n=1 Tax=Actinomortierella ambigua TaxID=1343610 RepID=A0A9P6UBQ7_9FUNG|nr:hypothetical protein DFQ26_007124 [Actinomortierella ambigua]KAG0268051.1 hypothetical protein DFQ27_007681 [Actinomortierella ambigua]